MKTTKGITSRIAHCQDCEWDEEANDSKALVAAKRHAKSFKHSVVVEVVTAHHYDYRCQAKDIGVDVEK